MTQIEAEIIDSETITLERGADHMGLGYREFTHKDLLRKAHDAAAERGLLDVFMIDADFHQSEGPDWREILSYVDNDVIEHLLRTARNGQPLIPGAPSATGLQEVGGRIRNVPAWDAERFANPHPTKAIKEAAEMIGANHLVLFPQHMLALGKSEFPQLEVYIARGYARWITEHALSKDSPVLAPLYLPFSDAEACCELVEEFGDHPGVIGATTLTTRYEATQDKGYMKLYAMLQERGLPLMFHAGVGWHISPQAMFNQFASLHALSFPYLTMVHCTNWVMNGLPERFPNLNVAWVEAGLSWVPFLMQRLDHTVMMRSSEVPLLKRLPSEYMREMYFTTQPLEATNIRELQTTLEFINAYDHLLWSSDWPHWDWDPPQRIWDLPFISEEVKRNILGANAAKLFGVEMPPVPAGN